MKKRLKVVQVGLGQIGLNILKALLDNDDRFNLIGCVDNAPDKTGRDVGEILDPKRIQGVVIVPTVSALKRKKGDIAIHSTVSYLPDAADQVAELLESGFNVVTTAEELFFLQRRNPIVFRRLNSIARRKGVRLLATGVDPGFIMDSLVLMLTAPCVRIRGVRAERMIDLSKRRLSMQRKIGIGLSTEEFLEESESGKFGPVGLTGSAEFIAHHLAVKYDEIKSTVQPISADHDFHGQNIFVAKDHVVGVRQEVAIEASGNPIISLRLSMRVDATIEYDAIFIDGDPPVNIVVNNGLMGDKGTVGLILNQIEHLLEAAPGYHDMADLAIPHFSLNHIS